MALRRLIFHEIAAHPVAERDDAEQFARLGERAAAAGIEILDRLAQLGEVGADAAILVDRLDRPIEEAVRCARRLGDLLAAHRGQLIDLLAEFGRVGIERDELVDEGIDALFELALLILLQGDQAGGLRGLDVLQRLGRIERQHAFGGGRGFGLGSHVCPRQRSFSRDWGVAAPSARDKVCYLYSTHGVDQAERKLTSPVSIRSGESLHKACQRVSGSGQSRIAGPGCEEAPRLSPWPGRFSFAFRLRSGPVGQIVSRTS